MPRFYVSLAFNEQPNAAFFVSGVPADKFVRMWIDHAARHLDRDMTLVWLDIIANALAAVHL